MLLPSLLGPEAREATWKPASLAGITSTHPRRPLYNNPQTPPTTLGSTRNRCSPSQSLLN
jgi:hypothetical protein